jgi:nucleotide-binding universal stress UspA family protein
MRYLDRRRAVAEARQVAGRIGGAERYREALDPYLDTAAHRHVPVPVDRPGAGLVIAGVEPSPASCTAVDHAAVEAELHGWDLRLLHVQHAAGGTYPARDEGARMLERMTDRVHACSPGVAVTSHLVVGAPATQLLTTCRDADLVVVGHRHGVAATAFGFSVGERVAAHHPGPVLVVRLPAWPPRPEYATRPVVAGVDGSSGPAIGFAVAEARLRGCDVIMLHAAGHRPAPADHMEIDDGVVVHHRTATTDPETALYLASGRAAAIVVAHGGHHGLPGSVSRAMIQRADCPIFLVG